MIDIHLVINHEDMPPLTTYTEQGFPLAIVYDYRIGTKSQVVYLAVLVFSFMALAALPLVRLQVSVKAGGVFQAASERSTLVVPVEGRVVEVFVRENQNVSKGDTILRIDASIAKTQLNLLEGHMTRLLELQSDVSRLLDRDTTIPDGGVVLVSGKYKAAWRQFGHKQAEKYEAKVQAGRAFRRYQYLYDRNAVTLSEFEKFKLEYEHALSAYEILTSGHLAVWQADAIAYADEIRELRSQIADLRMREKLYTITSPIAGSVQGTTGVQAGSYVFANQKIADLSPDTKIIAYCYVRPSDVGLIKPGQAVNFQVHSFNFHQWGLLYGRVLDIADDIIIVNNEPIFKVICSVDRDYLLSGKTKGYLRKGMDFTARFRVAERSLFQLLYDKAEDWLTAADKTLSK